MFSKNAHETDQVLGLRLLQHIPPDLNRVRGPGDDVRLSRSLERDALDAGLRRAPTEVSDDRTCKLIFLQPIAMRRFSASLRKAAAVPAFEERDELAPVAVGPRYGWKAGM
jgi:hypothetical protein